MRKMVILVEIKELRELSNKELEGKIREAKKELFNLRMKQSTGTLDKPSDIKSLRKNVARMKTILRERELTEANDEE